MPSDSAEDAADQKTDAALAAEIAQMAGDYLMALRSGGLNALRAGGALTGKALGQAGDEGANSRILAVLQAQRPDDAVLSEESTDTEDRLSAKRVWIVDPLDGTREYGEGRGDWAVHVALVTDGVALVGAVALPALGLVLRSDQVEVLPPIGTPLRMVVSRSRPAPEAVAVAGALGAELVPMGSAGAKAMAVVRGEADIYLHSGGQYEWDNAAPVAVARAHGLACSRLDGSPMRYNRPDPALGDFVICRAELLGRIMAELAGLSPSS